MVEEEFTGLPAEKLSIQFRDAIEFFDRKAYATAREDSAVSAAVCARVGLGMGREEIATIFPDTFGRALLMHCYNEFTFLSKFLPSLFVGENRDKIAIETPW